MTTPLDKTLKRGLTINDQAYVVAISPAGIKLTIKGRRNGVERSWVDLLNGPAAAGGASDDPDADSGQPGG